MLDHFEDTFFFGYCLEYCFESCLSLSVYSAEILKTLLWSGLNFLGFFNIEAEKISVGVL